MVSPSRTGCSARSGTCRLSGFGTIYDGRVELDLDEAGFERLGEHDEPPPSEVIRSDTTDL